MARKISKAKRAEEIAAIRDRLEDLYIGAVGGPLDTDASEDLLSSLSCLEIKRFFIALSNAFEWRASENCASHHYGLQFWHFDKFASFDRLAEHIFDSLAEDA